MTSHDAQTSSLLLLPSMYLAKLTEYLKPPSMKNTSLPSPPRPQPRTASTTLRVRKQTLCLLHLLLALSLAFILWRLLCLLTNSPHPIVVVISESMAPAFHRGDILFLSNRKPLVEVGDVPVVWFKGDPLPMVHRAVRVFNEVAAGGTGVV